MKRFFLSFRLLWVFCFLGGSLSSGLAQAPSADSMRQILSAATRLANQAPSDSVLQLFREVTTFFEEEQNEEVLSEAYIQWGKAWFRMGRFDSAQFYLDKGIPLAQTWEKAEALAEANNTLGGIHYIKGDYPVSTSHLLKAQHIYDSLGDKSQSLSIQANLASSYLVQGQNGLAKESYEHMIPSVDSMESSFLQSKVYFGYGQVLTRLEKYDSAAIFLKKSVQLQEEQNQAIPLATTLTMYGENEGFRGNYMEANEALDRAESLYADLGHSRGLSEVQRSRTLVLVYEKKFEKAIPLLEANLKHFQAQQESDDEIRCHELLALSYAGLGRYKEAYEAQVNYILLHDTIVGQKQLAEVARLTTQFETEKKENEILRLENVNAQSKLAISQQQRIIGGTVGGLLIIGLLAFFLYRNNQTRRKTNQLLSAQKSEIEQKNQQNETLLKEIHHRVKNNLQVISSLLRLQTSHIDDEAVREVVAAGEHRVKSMALIHQKLYQRENLSGVEMKEYLSTLGKSLIDTIGVRDKDIELIVEMPEIEVDVDTAVPLGLIANELITNSLKYAFEGEDQGNIRISLALNEEEMLELTVADNGLGESSKPQTEKRTSFGSRLIHLLSMQMDGEVEVDTSNGRTSKVAIREFTVLS